MFAYIKNNRVAQIIDADSLDGLYAPAFVERCVPCDATIMSGMVWDGESFGAAPAPVRTSTDVKQDLRALDMAVIRPLHTVTAGLGTQDDLDKLADLEASKRALRAELAAFGQE